MNEEDLDLLASAYLDGEATSEEVAIVEDDPQLLARVEELRLVGGRLGATVNRPASLKERHLAAALAAFDPTPAAETAPAAEIAPAVAPVVDLRERARQPEPARRRSMPQWLAAAAAFVLVGGGVVWLAGQTGSDDMDAATEAVDAQETAAVEPADGDATASMAAESADAAETSTEEEAMATSTSVDLEAMEQDEAAGADDGADTETGQAEGAEDTDLRNGAAPADGGFFPDDPVLQFFGPPDRDTLVEELPPVRADLTPSRCGDVVETPAGGELLGYLPIEIDGAPAEVFVAVDADGEELLTVFDRNCDILLP